MAPSGFTTIFHWVGLTFLLATTVIYTDGQLELSKLWELGVAVPHSPCTQKGVSLPFLPVTDPWFLTVACNTYQGSVSCINDDVEGKVWGNCGCNQMDDAVLDGRDSSCLGKIGAICTSVVPTFIPEKKCLDPNAECVSDQTGKGYSVGKCKCVYGYVEHEETRGCKLDEKVDDEDRLTPIVPTIPEKPDRGDFKLPPLDLLIGFRFSGYNQGCQSGALLNRTVCNTYWSTVSCVDHTCQCNMVGESIFNVFNEEENWKFCVGLTGSYCLTRPSIFGPKACTDGAVCVVEDGKSEEDYSFGTCQCLYGYREEDNGTCTRDNSIANPSTRKPWFDPVTTPESNSENYDDATDGSGATSTKSFIILPLFFCLVLSQSRTIGV